MGVQWIVVLLVVGVVTAQVQEYEAKGDVKAGEADRNKLRDIDFGWHMGDIAFDTCKEYVPKKERGMCDALQVEVEEILEKQENSTIHLIIAMEMRAEEVYQQILTKYRNFAVSMMKASIDYMRKYGLRPGVKAHKERIFGFVKMRLQGLVTDVVMQMKIPTYKGGKFGFAMGYHPEYEGGAEDGPPGMPGGMPGGIPGGMGMGGGRGLESLDPEVRARIEESLRQPRQPEEPTEEKEEL